MSQTPDRDEILEKAVKAADRAAHAMEGPVPDFQVIAASWCEISERYMAVVAQLPS